MRSVIVNGKEIPVGDKEIELLRSTASQDEKVASEQKKALAETIQSAWVQGVLEPDTLGTIFTRIDLPAGVDAKFPLDFYSPSKEGDYVAFHIPKTGALPDRIISGDEIRVATYKVGNAIKWSLDYARDARWDVIARAIEVYTNGFVRKMNDDGWHALLACAAVNSVTSDSAASAGVFSKQLLLNLMAAFKRQTGGRNSRCTDVFLSPEAINDIRAFSDTLVGDLMVRELVQMGEDQIPMLYGVRLHELQELGVGQEYQGYLVNTLGASLASGGDNEFCVAFDLMHRDSFVMPVREDMQTFDNPALHRSCEMGVYGWLEVGFACLDGRRVRLGSL